MHIRRGLWRKLDEIESGEMVLEKVKFTYSDDFPNMRRVMEGWWRNTFSATPDCLINHIIEV